MCGRFTLYSSPVVLAREFELGALPLLFPRYNIAPTQPIALVRRSVETGAHEWALARWGLVPSWADDVKIGQRMINARSETVADKPSFRSAFRRRRCLIPADGYYEWQQPAAGGSGKRPFYIRRVDQRPLAIAGLWESWQAPDGTPLETCTLLTTAANDRLRTIHDRMPVFLDEPSRHLWLDPETPSPALIQLLHPAADELFATLEVSSRVNNPRHESPDCIEPLETLWRQTESPPGE
jgi:putative SOS response-associated peptidase YedK